VPGEIVHGGTVNAEAISDAISIVEAAYRLEGDARSWLSGLLKHIAPRLDRGFGVLAGTVDARRGLDPHSVVMLGVPERVAEAVLGLPRAEPELVQYRPAAPLFTATQNIGLTEAEAAAYPLYVTMVHPVGIRDCIGAVALDPGGSTIGFCAPTADLRRPTAVEVTTWGRVLAHVGAGARLRRLLSGGRLEDSPGAEAILSPSGAVVHAKPGAQSSAARESLRAAAKSVDRARSKARGDEDEALDLWKGLVSGRWSLVDQFDSDGRRFLVAHKNDPQVSDPRALTLRERQILTYAAIGYPIKLIAYTLGLSPGTVSGLRARAMRKLGVRSVTELAALFSRSAGAASAEAGAASTESADAGPEEPCPDSSEEL
jgi:DNA-binding CsgD family transcriptional regulator